MDPSQWLAQLLLTVSQAQQQAHAQAHTTEPEGQGVGEAQEQAQQQLQAGGGGEAPAGGLAAPQAAAEPAGPDVQEQLIQLLLQLHQQQQQQQQHIPPAAAMPQPLVQSQPELPVFSGVPAALPMHPPPAAPWHPNKRARLEEPAAVAQQQQQQQQSLAAPPPPQAQAAAWELPQQSPQRQQPQRHMLLQLGGGVYGSPVGSLNQLTQVRAALPAFQEPFCLWFAMPHARAAAAHQPALPAPTVLLIGPVLLRLLLPAGGAGWRAAGLALRFGLHEPPGSTAQASTAGGLPDGGGSGAARVELHAWCCCCCYCCLEN